MNKRKKILISIIIILLLLIESSTLFLMYKSLNNYKSPSKLIELGETNKNMFAILVEQEDGLYKEQNTWPVEGYYYDSNNSGCVDKNGNILKNILSFNETTNVATLKTDDTTYCYLYFKKVCKLADDSSVYAGEYGAKYNCKVDPNKPEYTFYLLDNNEDGTSDLIMNANINEYGEAAILGKITDTWVQWNTPEDFHTNINGPITSMSYLYDVTKNWTNLEPLNYEYFDRQTQGITATDIGYESFISKNGIAIITKGDGARTEVKIGSENVPLRVRMPIYSSDINVTEIKEYVDAPFLYDNLDIENYESWTGSLRNGICYHSMSSNAANYEYTWTVFWKPKVKYGTVYSIDCGVRPVITVYL